MLKGEPDAGVFNRAQRKIALIAKFPKYVAASCALVIVNLQNPRLVPQRQKQIAIFRRVSNPVAVGPIGQAIKVPIDVEMVKGRPGPDRVPVFVQINQSVGQLNGTKTNYIAMSETKDESFAEKVVRRCKVW